MSANGISTLPTKELRQKAKLDLAAANRAADGNPRATYDITQLPTQYNGNVLIDNPNAGGLIEGRPWASTSSTPSYTIEFREWIGEDLEGEPGDIITECNEGEIICFVLIGVNVPDDENAYIQFGGASITNQDSSLPFPGNILDPIPYNLPGTETNSAPILIEADNLTEGNETLTLSWTVNGQTVATNSVTIVDTSLTPAVPLLYLDAGNTDSYPGSGTTWTDLSTYENDATLTGSPTFTNAGSASYFSFNGTDQFAPVTTSDMNVAFTGKTTMFSIRTVNANTANATYRNLFGGNTNARNFNTYMYHVSGSTWQLQFSTGPFPWVGPLSASFTVTDNEWIVVAVTQTTGGVLTYYVNGQQIGTPATGVTFSQFINSGIEAVARADNYWRGDMGVCAVYGRALTAEEIQQNYDALATRYFPPPVTTNLVASYNPGSTASYSGTGTALTDLSGNGLTGAMTDIAYTSPYFTYNGTSSRVSIADNALLEPTTGDFTVETWVYATTIAGSSRVILGKFNNGGASQHASYALRSLGTGVTRFEVGNGTSTVNSPTFTLNTGTWYQIVGVWTNVASNSIALYINGASQGSNSHAFASILNSTNPLSIGSYNNGEFAQWWDGRIGITRLYNKALSAGEVLQNYNADKTTYGL
jgi:hypothetical protein